MEKKYQIFISATFKDLRQERLAAARAILNAGHIPAGMEQFSAEDKTQLEVIKRWIDKSDIYMLILGGRYGSVDPKSGKSYTQIEYEYAAKRSIPIISILMTSEKMKKMRTRLGSEETKNKDKYDRFRARAQMKTVAYFEDEKDIEIAIHQALATIERTQPGLKGWISIKDLPSDDLLNTEHKLDRTNLTLNTLSSIAAQLIDTIPCSKKGSINKAQFNENIRFVHELVRGLILEVVSKEYGFRRFCVYEPAQVGGEIRLVRRHSYNYKRSGTRGFSPRPGEGIAGLCFTNKTIYNIPNVEAEPNFVPDPNTEREIKSLLCVPILVKGTSIAVINIDNELENAFTEFDQKMVESIANLWGLIYEVSSCPI